ncbi:MAG: AMP-binding protein, partial [Alphaproteobacteria bacterium]
MPARPTGPLLTLHHPATARSFYEAGLWREESFCDLLEAHAEARPNAFAIRDSVRRLTWSEFRDLVNRIAGHLAAAGLAPGERVGLRLSNRVECVAALLAASRLGAIANPSLHQNYTASEAIELVDSIGARIVLAE